MKGEGTRLDLIIVFSLSLSSHIQQILLGPAHILVSAQFSRLNKLASWPAELVGFISLAWLCPSSFYGYISFFSLSPSSPEPDKFPFHSAIFLK